MSPVKPVRHGFESEQRTHARTHARPPIGEKKRVRTFHLIKCAGVGVLCERPSWAPWTWRPLDPTRHMDPRLREWYCVNTCLQKDGQPKLLSIHKRFVCPSPGSRLSFSLDSSQLRFSCSYSNSCLHQNQLTDIPSRINIEFSTYISMQQQTHTPSRHCRHYIHTHQSSHRKKTLQQ